MTQTLKDLLTITRDDFEHLEYYWTTLLSDGTQKELKPNGANCRVAFEEIESYVRTVLDERLRESQPQYEAIKRGIFKIIPKSLMNIVTSKELENWVCGRNTIDVDLLMRHTKYTGVYSETHPVIKTFWEMFRN